MAGVVREPDTVAVRYFKSNSSFSNFLQRRSCSYKKHRFLTSLARTQDAHLLCLTRFQESSFPIKHLRFSAEHPGKNMDKDMLVNTIIWNARIATGMKVWKTGELTNTLENSRQRIARNRAKHWIMNLSNANGRVTSEHNNAERHDSMCSTVSSYASPWLFQGVSQFACFSKLPFPYQFLHFRESCWLTFSQRTYFLGKESKTKKSLLEGSSMC